MMIIMLSFERSLIRTWESYVSKFYGGGSDIAFLLCISLWSVVNIVPSCAC